MNQHISSMLEHLSLSSLRRKNSENAQTSSSCDKQNIATSQKVQDIDYKDVGDVESMSSKTKSIFKDLISDNGATNIFQNLNFIKCTSIANNSNANTTTMVSSSSSNGSCRKEQQQKNLNGDDNNNLHAANLLHPTTNDANNIENHKKRNSINGNGDLDIKRELSPPLNRTHRKSSHDIRIQRNNHMQDASENQDMGKSTNVVKPLKIKNIITQNETFDMLHCRAMDAFCCSNQVCMGSIMFGNVISTEPRHPDIVLEHSKDFISQYYTSIRRFDSPAHQTRWNQIEKEIQKTGAYQLSDSELIFGAKTAWRNSARCIGRIQWSKLQVFDCRQLSTPSQMFEALCNHIKYSTNKGNLRSAITIFPQRTDGKHDFRIWNSQLISYAGYKNADGSITGDPINVEITEVCLKLGWKGPRGEFDILPLILSTNGHDPEMFIYPPDLVVEVPLTHPKYKWFEDMNLKWYAAVSSMLFDCGGLVFPACAFSGWYMSTEIACRDLCDSNRRNLIETFAIKMGLDVRNPSSLWKDRALVEVNIAVLHSYQKHNITIVDHHTASESFMKHYENECKVRGGCPADWVWIVPPMSGSIMQVFHQEMATYYLRPSFEYQESAIKTHVWEKERESCENKKPRRKFHFKQIARAVKFTSKLFGRALSRRIKATVLYATETGKSEQYAKQLVEMLSHAFNAQIFNMAEYDISSIEHEALLLIVASTFGNGDPPENGEQFAEGLYSMKLHDDESEVNNSKIVTSSKSFIKVNSRTDRKKSAPKIDRLDSLRGSCSDSLFNETFGPLSNVRFAVFALGSSAYPNFCSFGKFVDNLLGELGGERLMKIVLGDDLCGQEHEFRNWACNVFKKSCEAFCLESNEISEASRSLKGVSFTKENTRFQVVKDSNMELNILLSKYHNKKVHSCKVKSKPTNLHCLAEKNTILVEISIDGLLNYKPGDHVGVCPTNRTELVDGILERLTGVINFDDPLQLQVLNEQQTIHGPVKTWENHAKIPVCSLRTLLTRFLDITSPPSRQFLTFLSSYCEDEDDKLRMKILATESAAYEDWRHNKLPHLLEVFDEFVSCRPPASLFIAHLMALQPRFYSISSSQRKYPHEVHLTVAVVKYKTNDGKASERYGVCSNYLESLDKDDEVQIFIRSAPAFHMPKDVSQPMILIGPGTGTAPFRSFWQELDEIKLQNSSLSVPKVWLFFGCRTKSLDLYSDEKREMFENGILNRVFLALSREPGIPKTYVQNLIMKEHGEIYNLIKNQNAHVYVCGDVQMAENVYQTLRKIIASFEGQTETVADKYMLQLRDENRYHEDIFGITLRTAEIHNKSRQTAKIKMESRYE